MWYRVYFVKDSVRLFSIILCPSKLQVWRVPSVMEKIRVTWLACTSKVHHRIDEKVS